MGIRLIIVGMVENEQGYEDFTDTSVHVHEHFGPVLKSDILLKFLPFIARQVALSPW